MSRLILEVSSEEGESLPCRVHLWDQQGDPVKISGYPFWHDHCVCPGRVVTPLSPGSYDYVIERGPEYKSNTGRIEIPRNGDQTLHVTLKRIAHLRKAGWYSGDLHVHRPISEIEQLMRAEDLDFAPVITWWNNHNEWMDRATPTHVVRRSDEGRIYSVMAGEDEREGGALLYFGLESPLDIKSTDREHPSPMQFVALARELDPKVWIDIEKPFWWDVPVWLASGRMNSIGIANNHMCRNQMYATEAWGKPRDQARLPNPRGNGFWSQEIYYHMLNSGLRLPPSAGSASGVLPNPVGYNRVYVHLDQPFTYEAWFQGLSQGRCFVTNGPLLLVTADSQRPGATFRLETGDSHTIEVNIQLTLQDPISQLEVIQNGRVLHTVQCSDQLTQHHSFDYPIDEPGWFLVRAVADVKNTFRFASTAPWFVETGPMKERVSRKSAQFFLDWTDERIKRIETSVKANDQRDRLLEWHEKARGFWSDRVQTANAD